MAGKKYIICYAYIQLGITQIFLHVEWKLHIKKNTCYQLQTVI